MDEIDVKEIEEAFYDVHERLCCGETVLSIPRRQAVDVVDVHIELVGRPDPVEIAAKEAAGSQENVTDIPGNDEGAEEQPGRDQGTRTVDCLLCCRHLEEGAVEYGKR